MTQDIREKPESILSGYQREECFKKGEAQVLTTPERPSEKLGLVTWGSSILWIYGADVTGG